MAAFAELNVGRERSVRVALEILEDCGMTIGDKVTWNGGKRDGEVRATRKEGGEPVEVLVRWSKNPSWQVAWMKPEALVIVGGN